jgi:hypothetical protein
MHPLSFPTSPARNFLDPSNRPVRLSFGFAVFEHLRVFLGCGLCIELDKSMAGWKAKDKNGMGVDNWLHLFQKGANNKL